MREKKVQKFTLIEVLISLSAFLILMLMMFNLLSSAQSRISDRFIEFDVFSEAQVISNYLKEDFEKMYVGNDLSVSRQLPLKIENTTIMGEIDSNKKFSKLIFFIYDKKIDLTYNTKSIGLLKVTWAIEIVGENYKLYRKTEKPFPSQANHNIDPNKVLIAYGVKEFKVVVFPDFDLDNARVDGFNSDIYPKMINISFTIENPNFYLQGEEIINSRRSFSELIYLNRDISSRL